MRNSIDVLKEELTMLHEDFVNTALDSTDNSIIDTTDTASDIANAVVETADKWSFDTKSAAIGALIVVGVQFAYNNVPKLVNMIKSGKHNKNRKRKNDDDFDFDDEEFDVDDADDSDDTDDVDVDDIEIVTDKDGNPVAAVKKAQTETNSDGNRAARRKKNKNRG